MSDLFEKYVILKTEYWNIGPNVNDRFEGFRLRANGTPEPARLRMPEVYFHWSGNLIKQTPRIGFVDGVIEIKIDGKKVKRAIVQTSFFFPRYRNGDYEYIDPSWLTTFKVTLRPDAQVNKDNSLGKPSEFKFGEIVDHIEDPDNNRFFVKEVKSGEESVYSTQDLLFLPDSKYQALKVALPLTVVSKTGFLPPEIPNDIQHVVFSQLSGLHSRYKPQNIVKNVQSYLYGPPQTIVQEPEPNVNALNAGPLPYGPTEENFTGGKQKKKTRKIKNKRRKTRKLDFILQKK